MVLRRFPGNEGNVMGVVKGCGQVVYCYRKSFRCINHLREKLN